MLWVMDGAGFVLGLLAVFLLILMGWGWYLWQILKGLCIWARSSWKNRR